MSKPKDKVVVESYGDMYKRLGGLTERELLIMINYEAIKYKRWKVLERMHMRYTKLRNTREREILKMGLPLF